MSILFDNPPPAIGCGDPGDPIEFGCLFDGSGELTKTFAEAGNRQEMTILVRLKLAGLPATQRAVLSANAGANRTGILISNSRLELHGDGAIRCRSDALSRDYAGHTSIVLHLQSTNADADQRAAFFVDLKKIPVTFPDAIPLDWNSGFFSATQHAISGLLSPGDNRLSGYVSEIIAIEGSLVAPEEFDYVTSYGHVRAKRFAGTGGGTAVYGPKGFHLDFADPLDLGKDISGNGNHFTSSGLTANNQVTDTPTNTKSTFNPTFPPIAGNNTGVLSFASGNRRIESSTQFIGIVPQTSVIPNEKKWVSRTTIEYVTGVAGVSAVIEQGATDFSGNVVYLEANGTIYVDNAIVQSGLGSIVAEDVVDTFVDPQTRQVFFNLNGAPFGSPVSIPGTGRLLFAYPDARNTGGSIQQLTDISPIADYYPLTSAYMPCPDILNPDDYFTIRQSTGGADVTDLPWDTRSHKTLVISKRTDTNQPWRIHDTLRGAGLPWSPNPADPEITTELDGLTAFTDTGYTIGADAPYQGSRIDYVFRASPKSGFDILTLDHVNGAASTVPHLAGGAIEYAWVIPLDGGDRRVFHSKLPSGDYLKLNENDVGTDVGWFSSAANTVTLGASMPSGRYILYVWRAVPQFSAFEVHAGTGDSDGAMVPVDFQPRVWLCKRDGIGQHTAIQDTERNPENPATQVMYLRLDNASSDTGEPVDFVSSGAKTRSNSIGNNASGSLYYSALWAEFPGKFARAR
ncbi:hypothetical protein [Thalassospira sp.]|uniref:DUF7483 domain-containing protein n=1 Tax=Thalassospira sp. TaxID=1912094 RepID=UPI000C4B3881|nr:hypothetical protein [Thalassospira sp.]MBC06369.1 hypothetical protein [Thalassospira sp.]|tara:strand:+ start:2570 stop:4792 length:2223 start_codon:yes stop_codon:yes gene_type:complete